MTQGAASVLDLSHLAQYTGGDPNLEREILGMFVPSVEGYLEQMRRARKAIDWQHAAHAMKGVSRGVGAFQLADLAETYECRFAEHEDQRQAMIDDLERQISIVSRIVGAHLND